MQPSNSEVIRQGYAAHARGDIASVFANLHPEIEIRQTELLPWGGVYRGHTEVGSFFRKLNENIESQVEPGDYVEAEDTVAVTGWIRGHVRANQAPFHLRIIHLWTLNAGRVVRFEAYIDTPGMLRALGAEN